MTSRSCQESEHLIDQDAHVALDQEHVAGTVDVGLLDCMMRSAAPDR